MKKDVKWCFIVNPAAGRGAVARRWPQMELALQRAGISFEVVKTDRQFHAATLARQAIEHGFRAITAVGGDGTAHEVVNGIFDQTFCSPDNITFSLLPVGTGNDWIKTHHIPKRFHKWLDVWKAGRTGFQDVGELSFQKEGRTESRYFINVAGLSFDGYVTKKAVRNKSILPSSLVYLALTTRCLFSYRVPKASIRFNGQERKGRFLTINAGICRFSGGGMQLVPHANPHDGKLALMIAGSISKLEVLLATPLFYTGKLNWHPQVSLYQTDEIRVQPEGPDPVFVEADGEFLGEAPAVIRMVETPLRILVP